MPLTEFIWMFAGSILLSYGVGGITNSFGIGMIVFLQSLSVHMIAYLLFKSFN